MAVPRMRTLPEAYRELKKADPNTAYTLKALRAAVKKGEIPVLTIGSNKRLVNLDTLFEMLSAPSCEGNKAHEGGKDNSAALKRLA